MVIEQEGLAPAEVSEADPEEVSQALREEVAEFVCRQVLERREKFNDG